MRTVTDPFSAVVTYGEDKAARTTGVTGSGFASVSTYASGMQYRAFGGLKQMTYGSADGSVVSFTYDNALRAATYQSTSSVLSSGFVRKAAYEYFADGRTKAVDNIVDGRFDQAYSFDHLGRLKSSTSGLVTNSEEEEVPAYAQWISYNAFGNMTSRSASVWGGDPNDFTASYTDNRKTGGNEVFDFDGNIVDTTTDTENYTRWKFDASGAVHNYGRAYEIESGVIYEYVNTLDTYHDGDGRIVKRHSERDYLNTFTQATSHEEDTSYFVVSTVLGGQALTELDGDGDKVGTKVYANGAEIAEQRADSTDVVVWKHVDAITGSRSKIAQSGYTYNSSDSDFNAEIEPFGAALPNTDPYAFGGDPDTQPMPTRFKHDGNVFTPEMACMLDYMSLMASQCKGVFGYLESRGIRQHGGYIWVPVTGNGIDVVEDDEEPIYSFTYEPIQVSASSQHTTVQQTNIPFDVKGIEKGIKAIWNDPTCRDIIQRLLDGVSSRGNPLVEGGDITKLFGLLMQQRGLTRQAPPGSAGYGSPTGLFKKENAQVFVAPVSNGTAALQLLSDTRAVVDEIMHLAGKNRIFTDRDFSDVVKASPDLAKLTYRVNLPPYTPRPYPLDVPNLTKEQRRHLQDNEGDPMWGGYWHSVVYNTCTMRADPPF